MATETPVDPRTRTREEIPEGFTWNLADIYADWAEWEAGLAEFDAKLAGYAELRGTLAQGPERLLKAFRLEDELGQLSYKLWYYAGPDLRPGPARQRGERAAAARPDSVREGGRGEVLVYPRAAAHSPRNRAQLDGGESRAGGLPVRHRAGLSPAGARPRREGRASAVAGEPVRRLAPRYPFDAGERGHQAPGDYAARRQERDAHLRAVQRAAADQPASARSGGRVPARFTRRSRQTRTPMRRSTTACCSATGSSPRRDSSRARSRRRCMETTFRRPSSRTSSRPQRPAPSPCAATIGSESGCWGWTRTTPTTSSSR